MANTESRLSLAKGLLVVVALTSAPVAFSTVAAQAPEDSSDFAEVEAVARHYIEGWYTGNPERMERSLHVDLVKRMPVGADSLGENGLRSVSRERMIALTRQGGGEDPDADFEIFVDDVSTDIATARVLSRDYLDYLHLARTPDGWKIVNVLFHVRE